MGSCCTSKSVTGYDPIGYCRSEKFETLHDRLTLKVLKLGTLCAEKNATESQIGEVLSYPLEAWTLLASSWG